jgi:putative phage-type endonuclease
VNAVATVSERAQFHAERRQGVGASEVAAMIDAHPWESRWSIWAAKVGLTPPLDEPTDSMRLGTDLEPVIGRWFHQRTGLYVAGEQTFVVHRREPWAIAHLDGYVLESPPPPRRRQHRDHAVGLFEAKYTADSWDELPLHYRLQVQWQMYVTAQPRAWVAALMLPFGRPRFTVFEVKFDRRQIDELAAATKAFWLDHVVTGIPPAADEHQATTAAIGAAWGGQATVKVPTVNLDEHRQAVDELAAFRAQRNALKPLIEGRENELKAAFGAAADTDDQAPSEGVVDGELVASWRSQKRTDLDVAAVRAEHGNTYDRVSTVRVLRLHGRSLR